MYCLDTNVIILALNERSPKLARRLDAEIECGTPLLVPTEDLFELEYGYSKSKFRDQNRARLSTFLSAGFDFPVFETGDAVEAGEIRARLEVEGQVIGPYDILIAAQARRRGATLVTLNRREFERVPGLVVTDWLD
jgi:tRNA(fMet)-specific endonuclease VapC